MRSKLVYIINTSLDGYIEDASGSFNWTYPEQMVFDFITELLAPIGTYLYGRRVYETMSPYWDADVESYPPEQRKFARIYQKAQKIVFSRNSRHFDTGAVLRLKSESGHDIAIAGAELANQALDANLVDECHLFLHPVIVGSGKPAFRAGLRRNLELLETRRFDTGVIYVHYRIPAHA